MESNLLTDSESRTQQWGQSEGPDFSAFERRLKSLRNHNRKYVVTFMEEPTDASPLKDMREAPLDELMDLVKSAPIHTKRNMTRMLVAGMTAKAHNQKLVVMEGVQPAENNDARWSKGPVAGELFNLLQQKRLLPHKLRAELLQRSWLQSEQVEHLIEHLQSIERNNHMLVITDSDPLSLQREFDALLPRSPLVLTPETAVANVGLRLTSDQHKILQAASVTQKELFAAKTQQIIADIRMSFSSLRR